VGRLEWRAREARLPADLSHKPGLEAQIPAEGGDQLVQGPGEEVGVVAIEE
jgi:hypothetical protein